MKREVIALILAAIAAALLLMGALSGCKTSNVHITDAFEVAATKESFIDKGGMWKETSGRFVNGDAVSEMQCDSTYRMQTEEGWIISIHYSRIIWFHLLPEPEPHIYEPEQKESVKPKHLTSVDYGF